MSSTLRRSDCALRVPKTKGRQDATPTCSTHTDNTDRVSGALETRLPGGTGGSKERRGGVGCGTRWPQHPKAERKGRSGRRRVQSVRSRGRSSLTPAAPPARGPSAGASVHLQAPWRRWVVRLRGATRPRTVFVGAPFNLNGTGV